MKLNFKKIFAQNIGINQISINNDRKTINLATQKLDKYKLYPAGVVINGHKIQPGEIVFVSSTKNKTLQIIKTDEFVNDTLEKLNKAKGCEVDGKSLLKSYTEKILLNDLLLKKLLSQKGVKIKKIYSGIGLQALYKLKINGKNYSIVKNIPYRAEPFRHEALEILKQPFIPDAYTKFTWSNKYDGCPPVWTRVY